ncbi:diacylglycerol kinase family protein [Amorphoplanes digitatis]|uniref:Diacylglycerol kinase (ATP) n=1 Tax=Actinoplanes digitatis TaxID=1868 RepID=A0A7W7MQ90_9ACTN|nr:diacylglycerol kinase family protein [Actinoplanes digitatis]MBB4762335.1 diacylglycerol kinase (ATP) [Actinoplanes digitatis]GID92543.1 diacylglycerol kinase [Actinoplanes digitatis]
MTSDDIAVLANPLAGRGRHRGLLSQVLDRLGASGRTVRLLSAASAEEAEKACHRAVAEGVGALVGFGGDGTLHRTVQAVAGTTVGFGMVPAGTGNDFVAGTGVPSDPLAAADAIADAVRTGRATEIDMARVTTAEGDVRWFGAVLAAGFDAIVNERANRMRWPRGPRRYDLAILLELARLRPRDYSLVLDGVDHSFSGVLVAVGNCASYGGGMLICPDADPADGLLDIVVAGPLGRGAVARLKPRLRRGTHVTDPAVTSYRAREVKIASEGIFGYADGERVAALDLVVTCVPGAVRLLR